MTGTSAWFGPDMACRDDWVYPLSPREIEEIRLAATPWMTQDPAGITAAAFELPQLAPRLLAIRHEVLQGRGFALLRGLPAQVNLIPLNPTAGYDGAPTHTAAAKNFQRILAEEFSLPSTVRQRRGIDIAAGCGQLATAG